MERDDVAARALPYWQNADIICNDAGPENPSTVGLDPVGPLSPGPEGPEGGWGAGSITPKASTGYDSGSAFVYQELIPKWGGGGSGWVPQRRRLFKFDFPSPKFWVQIFFLGQKTLPPSCSGCLGLVPQDGLHRGSHVCVLQSPIVTQQCGGGTKVAT